MKRLTAGRRPSPSLVISIIALIVSVSGVAWAGSQISGSQLKSRSVDDSS
jgi:hypothetical protein